MSTCVVMQIEDDPTTINSSSDVNSLATSSSDSYIIKEIKTCLSELGKYMLSCEESHMTRVISGLAMIKKFPAFANSPIQSIQNQNLGPTITQFLLSGLFEKDLMINFSTDETGSCGSVLFLGLLVSILLLKIQKEATSDLSNRKACLFTANLLRYSLAANRRELDALTSKLFYYHSLSYERSNLLQQLLKSTCVRGDETCQSQLINLILRCYILSNDYEQAAAFASRTTFPEHADNNQNARHLYYLGLIHAVRGSYQIASELLNVSARCAPQGPSSAIGFQQAVHKLLVVVLLLAGELPERSLFEKSPFLEQSLRPYFSLVQGFFSHGINNVAVRKGDITLFEQVVNDFKPKFENDKNLDLVLRLRHCVIRAGLRLISLSYSRISLKDIAEKLHIQSGAELLSVLNQAISNGIILGSIEDENLVSQPTSDVYITREPQNAFVSRSVFCLKIRELAQSALRYPQETYTEGLNTNHSTSSDNNNNSNAECSENGKSEDKQSDSDDSSVEDILMMSGDADEGDDFDAEDFL